MDTGQNAFAAALLDPSVPVPSGMVTASGVAADRFAVYRNNVAVGLRRALASNFPVVARLVGEEFFAVLARAFIRRSLPASPLLFAWGEGFADFIESFGPAAAVPYLADVARLEFARLVAHHAADGPALEVSCLAGLAPAALEAARLVPHPAARLISSRYAASAIWLAHQGPEVRRVRDAGPERVLLTRPRFEVRMTTLLLAEFRFAHALLRGTTVGAAAIAAADDPSFDFGSAMVSVAGAGAFSGIRPPGTEASP